MYYLKITFYKFQVERSKMDEEGYRKEMGEILVTLPGTGAVQQQIAYYNSDKQT